MSIGKNIRNARMERGMTQFVLAERIGVSENYIYQIESDRKKPSIKTIEIICDVLDAKITHILRGDRIIDKIRSELADEARLLYENLRTT